MKTSIETINGKQYTVVWHENTNREYSWKKLNDGTLVCFCVHNGINHIATALPALPRYQKPKDARLLYRYMAEGLMPIVTCGDGYEWTYEGIHPAEALLTHATTETGERCDVAIEGDV